MGDGNGEVVFNGLFDECILRAFLLAFGKHHTSQKQYQNRKQFLKRHFSTLCNHTFENSFLITGLFPFSSPLPRRHHIMEKVLGPHITVNIFRRKKICRNSFPLHFLYFFPISSLKLFPLSKQNKKKSLTKPDTFDFKPSPSSCYTCIRKNRKTQKTVRV